MFIGQILETYPHPPLDWNVADGSKASEISRTLASVA